ncbi:MAG TPA: DUF6438 domain-containing protein [Mucilaginibacter sp.]|jgi:hypothetical protein
MKKLFVAILLLLTSLGGYANKIDSLNNDNDVRQLLLSLIKKTTPSSKSDNKINIVSWKKADFNNDKLTDLAVYAQINSYYPPHNYVIIDKGQGDFQSISITKAGDADARAPLEIIDINGKKAIIFKTVEYTEIYKKDDLQHPSPINELNPITTPITDTLVYNVNGFVEFNKHPVHHEIDSVIFHAGPCYGPCPIFYAKVDSRGVVRFEKDKPVKPVIVKDPWGKPGKTIRPQTYLVAKTKLTANETKELFDLIDYIDFKNLKNHYTVPWTDDVHGWIRVKYKDGTSKEIEDYGEKGTFGLSMLFGKFYELAKANKID